MSSLRAGGRAKVRVAAAVPARAEPRAAADDTEVTEALGELARHRTGQIEVVPIDDGGILDVDAGTLDHVHPDLEGEHGGAAIDRLAIAVAVSVLTEHPADARLGSHRIVSDERVVLTVEGETGELAVLPQPNLLDDPTVDQTDVVSEQPRVRGGPERDLRDGLE